MIFIISRRMKALNNFVASRRDSISNDMKILKGFKNGR